MPRHIRLASFLVGALALACTDSAGPPEELVQTPVVQATDFQPLQWSAPATGTESETVRITESGRETLKDVTPLASSSVVSMATAGTSQHSFWAVQGEDREIILYRVVQTWYGYQKQMLVEFDVDKDTDMTLPDGTPVAEGDSVLITLVVDNGYSLSHLYPSGLQFSGNLAELELYYDDTGMSESQEEALNMWYQADYDDPWSTIQANQSTSSNYLEVLLEHFSGYAVAF